MISKWNSSTWSSSEAVLNPIDPDSNSELELSPLLLLTAGIGGELERTGAGGGVEPKKYNYGVYWKYSGIKIEK